MQNVTLTFVTAAAIAQYKAVKSSAVDFGCEVATANAKCLGITGAPTTAAGEEAPIIMFGETEALLGDTVSHGDWLKSDANGDLVPAASAADNVIALALEDGVDNDVVRVFVLHVMVQTATPAITDPGDAGAIPVTQSGYCDLVTGAQGETRTLAAPTAKGQTLLLSLKTDGGGDCVITCATTVNQTGNTTITLGDAGDAIYLIAKTNGANIRWSVVSNDGCALTTP